MTMKRLGMGLALACCGAGAAKADWEYTAWGMSPQQVAAAAKNLTKESADLRPDSNGYVTRMVAPYVSGRLHFEAQFGFDAANRLSAVTLVLNDKTAGMDVGGDTIIDQGGCYDLLLSVNDTYGPPQGGGAAHMQYSIETWQDQKNKNNVTFTVLDGVGCYVQYSVIKPGAAN